MENEAELISLRVDDLPILHEIIKDLQIGSSIDAVLGAHGNWSGNSIGTIAELWLCYILNACDHRLQNVEGWSVQNLLLLQVLSGKKSLKSLDFTDDRLGWLLDQVGLDSVWSAIEALINPHCLSVYRLGEQGEMATFRLDSAPMQHHGAVEEGGLLQYGYHKHHADLPQFKVKLCSLDNELTHSNYPVASMTVSGNRSDDELYIPIIAQSKAVLGSTAGYEEGNLYVGDSKMGSIGNRAYVVSGKDYYLMPLSAVQLSHKERNAQIAASDAALYTDVRREEDKKMVTIAQGFETELSVSHEINGEKTTWNERRLFVKSAAYAASKAAAFDARVAKTQAALADLCVRKKGKPCFEKEEELQSAIDKLLKDSSLADFLKVEIIVTSTEKTVRAYRGNPARTDVTQTFSLHVSTDEAAIATHKTYLGWQVYATNVRLADLSFTDAVLKYRHQSNIEHNFDDLRNKVAHLVPIFLQKQVRIKGLVHILLLALKVCSVLEYKIAAALHKSQTELSNIYEGNPKRSTDRPSTKRICKAFKGVSIAIVLVNRNIQYVIMTNLNDTQRNILQLLGINNNIYDELSEKIRIFFSNQFFNET